MQMTGTAMNKEDLKKLRSELERLVTTIVDHLRVLDTRLARLETTIAHGFEALIGRSGEPGSPPAPMTADKAR